MPTPEIVVNLDTSKLDAIARDANITRDAIIRRAAFEIENIAKQLAPVDTSALRNSIYVVTPKEDGFQQADSDARGKNPDVTTNQIPAPGEGQARIGPAVDYGAAIEFGHVTKAFTVSQGAQNFVPAQPYMTPAFEQVKAKLEDGSTYKELVKQ